MKRAPHLRENWILLTDAQARRLVQGDVPAKVRETLRRMLEWRADDLRTWHRDERGDGRRRA